MTTRNPVRYRGRVYPSQRALAQAIGVHESAICNALREGRLDRVNTDRSAALRKPCMIDGKRYPSRTAAAEALGVTKSAITKRLRVLASLDF